MSKYRSDLLKPASTEPRPNCFFRWGDCGPLDLPICAEFQCCILEDFDASPSPRQCQLWNSSWSIAGQGRKAKGSKGSTWLNMAQHGSTWFLPLLTGFWGTVIALQLPQVLTDNMKSFEHILRIFQNHSVMLYSVVLHVILLTIVFYCIFFIIVYQLVGLYSGIPAFTCHEMEWFYQCYMFWSTLVNLNPRCCRDARLARPSSSVLRATCWRPSSRCPCARAPS